MPVITSQKEANRRARSVGFCYLCGRSIGSKDPTQNDHVVPRALRNLAPSEAGHSQSDSSEWSPQLRVHPDCHREKNPDEQLLVRYCRVMCDPSALRRDTRDLMPIAKGYSLACTPNRLGQTPVFVRVEPVYRAIWRMVRGFHSLLYGQALLDPVRKSVFPPVPSYTNQRRDSDGRVIPSAGFDEREEIANSILSSVLDQVASGGPVDGIVAWRRRVLYTCRWLELDAREPRYRCLWVLECGNSSGFVREEGWDCRPWTGIYETGARPPAALV